ncbi:MAG: FAD-binding oxidoreductase [Nitriliruptorales bacterium]|nr:FAD-binding oxidoreductase [Nitriliruptorales bacterium]
MQTSLLDELSERAPDARILTDPDVTASHSHDWWPRLLMRRRAGWIPDPPEAVVVPATREEVATTLEWAAKHGVAIVPFGAGTGVCGGAAPVAGAVTVDLKRLNAIGDLDEYSGIIDVEPGVFGQSLEDHLNHRGWTLGHFPSSIHCSTIGGFLAIRSAGQASTGYGKLADMVVGLEVVLPDGRVMRTRVTPSSASGPDLASLFLGSEGTTGIITRAWLRVRPLPEAVLDHGYLVPDLGTGIGVLRDVMHGDLHPAVLRLYDETDTAVVFGSQGLEVPAGCLVIVGCEGSEDVVRLTQERVAGIVQSHGGEDLGAEPGRHWREHRHSVSYRFADYMKPGGDFGDALTLDTIEVATVWSNLLPLYTSMKTAMSDHVDLVLAHISHCYPAGASIYFTVGAINDGDEDQALERYDAVWDAAMRSCLDAGGTISHHHGVGLARAPYLAAELGETGFDVLWRLRAALDPDGRMNPGKLGLPGGTRART